MAKKASSNQLRDAFTSHLKETEGHVDRLEKIGRTLGVSLKGKTCHAMEGLIKEGKEAVDQKGQPAVMDANLIGAALRVEHYEMAAYGTARAIARQLGHKEVAELLQETLDEEGAANKKLSAISEKEVLAAAEQGEEASMSRSAH